MSYSREIIQELREELESKKVQREALVSQLTLFDVFIDKFDDLIVNMDKDALTFIHNINQAIIPVKNAYDERISSGCRSDLRWKIISSWSPSTNRFSSSVGVTSYYKFQVVKNENTYSFTPYRGIKYFQKPLNRDYGSNLVGVFSGSISTGSTILAITDTNLRQDLIEVGDNIIDSVTNPIVFNSSNIPSVVGFGTTSIVGVVTTLVGGITAGSTVFAHYGPGVSTVGVNTGMLFQCPNVINATIVGFGTTSFDIEELGNDGEFVTISVPCDAVVLSDQAQQTAEENVFTVGILTTVQSISLSTVAVASTENQLFNVIRPGDIDIEFDFTQSPLEPLTIGIVNSSTLGVGNSAFFDASGNPNQTSTWAPSSSYFNSSTNTTVNPEPSVGAGRAEYYIGTFSWPVIVNCSGTAPFIACTSQIASEGTIAITTSSTSSGIGTTNRSGPDPNGSFCNGLTQNITNAINNLTQVLAQNESRIQPIINATKALRSNRDSKELRAWSILQAIGSITKDIKRIEGDLNSLNNIDFGPYETS